MFYFDFEAIYLIVNILFIPIWLIKRSSNNIHISFDISWRYTSVDAKAVMYRSLRNSKSLQKYDSLPRTHDISKASRWHHSLTASQFRTISSVEETSINTGIRDKRGDMNCQRKMGPKQEEGCRIITKIKIAQDPRNLLKNTQNIFAKYYLFNLMRLLGEDKRKI